MKDNFKCPRCRKGLKVGKHLRSRYICYNCKAGMLISKEEVNQGHVNYKRNFLTRY